MVNKVDSSFGEDNSINIRGARQHNLKNNDLFGNHTPSLSNKIDVDDRLWRILNMRIYPWVRL